MRSFASIVAAAVCMAAVSAVSPEDYTNYCFHCVDEGYMFCADDSTGKTGTCVDVTCTDDKIKDADGEDTSFCVLEDTSTLCPQPKVSMLAYS